MGDPKRHHFVPRLLLRPWLVGNDLHGYWWDARHNELKCKIKGLGAFCNRIDLLTLKTAGLQRYDIEKIFFGDIDDKGAKARDRLLEFGPNSLSIDQRCDFARLLLSLEVRRPSVVSLLRVDGTRHLTSHIDGDPEILAAFSHIDTSPSAYAEKNFDIRFEDRALSLIQKLVDNPRVGVVLLNAIWHLAHLGPRDGSFVLSDRPLIRVNPFDKPGATWALPLTPKIAFVAVNHIENLNRIKRVSGPRLAKNVNWTSARQAEQFIFSVDYNDKKWLSNYLKKSR